MKPTLALLILALIVCAGGVRAVEAGQIAAVQAGASFLKENGESPPLCCRERETWMAPGGRLAGQLGYAFQSPFLVRAELGLALYQVVGQDHLSLRVLSPDAAAYAGARWRSARVVLDVAAGVGWRYFSGTAREPSGDLDTAVSRHAADLRLALGLRAPLGSGRTLGAELTVARVLIDQTVGTLSLTLGWGD